MKYFYLIFLAIQIFATSCSQINTSDLQGSWSYQPARSPAPEFTEFIIRNDSAELIADDLFKEMSIVSIEGNNLIFKLIRDNLHLTYEIDNLNNDTLNIKDSIKFLRNSYLGNDNFEGYELLNISTDNLISTKANFYNTIHFYKSEKDELRIRCGHKMAELRDIPLFLMGHHQTKPAELLILLGKGIVLRDLKSLYFVLQQSGYLNVYLGTKRFGIADTEVFRDNIEIWWDDAEEFRKSQKPMPPPFPPKPYKNKSSFLGNDGREILINTSENIPLIDSINDPGKYVIEINSKLSIDQYIKVKQKVNELKIKNKKVRTSIN